MANLDDAATDKRIDPQEVRDIVRGLANSSFHTLGDVKNRPAFEREDLLTAYQFPSGNTHIRGWQKSMME
jgi:hypothetical protein